jgi:hypothetical protein
MRVSGLAQQLVDSMQIFGLCDIVSLQWSQNWCWSIVCHSGVASHAAVVFSTHGAR